MSYEKNQRYLQKLMEDFLWDEGSDESVRNKDFVL